MSLRIIHAAAFCLTIIHSFVAANASAALVNYWTFDGTEANEVGGGVTGSLQAGATYSSTAAPGIGSEFSLLTSGGNSGDEFAISSASDRTAVHALITSDFTLMLQKYGLWEIMRRSCGLRPLGGRECVAGWVRTH